MVFVLAAIMAAFVLLGWPFKQHTITVPEEVTTTVIETVKVPVTVYRWFVWPVTEEKIEQVPKEVTETIIHGREIKGFSAWLLIPMALIGWLAHIAEAWTIHLILRWQG